RRFPSAVLCCFCASAAWLNFRAGSLDPRGARPVEPSTRSENCPSKKEWPFCSDDDWGPKCPSGCRIQGLMDKHDFSLLKKIEKIRNLLDQNKAKFRTADQASKQTYDYLKDKLTLDSDNSNKYYALAQNLRRNINDMKIKIDAQLRALAALKDRVRDQVSEMQRLEVDIDIKLRSCKGSCERYSAYQMEVGSYVALEKQLKQLDSPSSQSVKGVETLYVMKSRPLKDDPVDSLFKAKDLDGQQKEDVFHEINTVTLLLEQEGSSSSPATVSKVPGTSFSPSIASSSSASSSKPITELSGPQDGGLFDGQFDGLSSKTHLSTQTTSCTRFIKTTLVQTAKGPIKEEEEVMKGGPECQTFRDLSKGELTSLFPTLTLTIHTGGTKQSQLGVSEPGLVNPFDLGAFMMANAEDDVPDLQARSVKTTRVERKADYVGKDCVEAHQYHLKGESNGLFKIRLGGTKPAQVVEVYCQQEGLMGGWLLVQQRESGEVSFNRSWAEYRSGFGSVGADGRGEFWLGNQNFHWLTSQSETLLRVEMEDWEGGAATAEYTVRLGSEEEAFSLHVSGYAGDGGDALLLPGSHMAPFLSHNRMKFSTFDKDNDEWEQSCAQVHGGGWWYNRCQAANLNGVYYQSANAPENEPAFPGPNGVVWSTFRNSSSSLKAVRMLIRPAAF
uniref:Fibrinogen alpha chain n=1 Tax=Tetraodon nigroviridis TaxID=99883 RepID=H3C7P2_TETNG